MAGIKPGKYDASKPDIELFDFMSKRRYGLKLDGAGALKIGVVATDDTVYVRNVGKRPGDFDEQRSWKRGRGVEDLSSDAEGYWDSKDAWSLTPNFLHQTLLWQFANGIVAHDVFLPDKTHSVTFKSLIGGERFLSNSFASNGLTAAEIMLWVRRKGNPGTLTIQLRTNSSGDPSNTTLQSATLTASSLEEEISFSQLFSISSQALTGGTTYHIVVSGASGDTKNNCWQIGGYSGGLTGKKSTGGAGSWSAASFDLYYRVKAANVVRSWFSFFLDGAMYVVDSKADGSASQLWINGDRGKSTGATSTLLGDAAKSWTVDMWAGAWVAVIRGTGRGQFREIESNTSNSLTVSDAFDVVPDTTSEFIIYGTKQFTEITSTGLSKVKSTPAVVNQIVWFPQGESANVRTMVYNATTKAHEFDDNGTTKADFINIGVHKIDGVQVWLARNGLGSGGQTFVFRCNAPVWASPPADLVSRETVHIGDRDAQITNILEKDGVLQVFKWDGYYNVSGNQAIRIQSGLEKTPHPANGAAVIIHQKYMYYSWLHSIIRIFGGEHDDVGQEWSGKGLPDTREGTISSFDSYASLLLYGINAGTGTSSVMSFDGIGTHEILRAYSANRPVSLVKVQPCIGTRNMLWSGQGGDLVFQELPLMKGSPRLDSGMRYQHEAVLVSAKIDMGTAAGMPKFFKELTLVTENLDAGKEILVQYQTDDDVGTSNWTTASSALLSPESNVFLGLNNVRSFSYRLILRSNDNTVPLIVRGVTPNGFARTPYKMVWTLRCRADNVTVSKKLAKSTELMRWLLDMSRFPYRVEMRSQYHLAHKFFVTVHPPSMFPYKAAVAGQDEESVFTLVLEEV